MDLLHAYSKQLGETPPAGALVEKARRSRRSTRRSPIVQRARQLRDDEVEALIEHYRENGSVALAAKALGVARQTAGKYLGAAGISTTRHMTATELRQARSWHDDGLSATTIGRRLGYSPHTISKALRAAPVDA